MKSKGPILTLLAGVALALVLAVVNIRVNTVDKTAQNATGAGASPGVTASAQPGGPATPLPQRADFAGRTAGGEASIAVAIRDGKIVAYVCDGKQAEAWFRGAPVGDTLLNLEGKDGAKLSGSFGGGALTGAVTVGGKTWQFSAPSVQEPAGLYRADTQIGGSPAVVGWIVQPTGKQVGIRKTGAELAPAPALDTTSRTATVNGTQITAQQISGVNGAGF